MQEPTPPSRSNSDWKKMLLLAFIGLPVTMAALIALYGFVLWGLQVMFFGPPGA
ncbi:hypothetical protein [Craterilacuibacter sp. RT1T]|uniref:hypothetical protein n=1 Tax=Craterilacuibacter sp. RT1T TaxID=2942211 RepID=UPI0020BEE7A2|nr:hypothetical protein [Craterilacuibacter sp. RT1T]MCL6263747.1 hypothetical protein [Craterilacuibacter sp. RT1T]